jgi:hypothetical protein
MGMHGPRARARHVRHTACRALIACARVLLPAVPSFGKLDSLNFVVMHFAEAVQYTAIGWLDKNRGYLHPDVAYVLTQSDSALMRELFPMSILDVSKKATVGALFRKSLRSLSATMLTTAQNYVRAPRTRPHPRARTLTLAARPRCAPSLRALAAHPRCAPSHTPSLRGLALCPRSHRAVAWTCAGPLHQAQRQEGEGHF